jgi:hypothetical protein
MTPATLFTIAIYGVCILGYGLTLFCLILGMIPLYAMLTVKFNDQKTAASVAMFGLLINAVLYGTITTIIYAILLAIRNSL